MWSHCTGFSLSKTHVYAVQCGFIVPDLFRLRWLVSHLLAYSPTNRGDTGNSGWDAQRDSTVHMDLFETTVFRMSLSVFLHAQSSTITLDDDLFGSRARDNQVKNISTRKADKEGHCANALCDALFLVCLALRFRSRGETNVSNYIKLVDVLSSSTRGVPLAGVLLVADRGFANWQAICRFAERGVSGLLVMPEHLLACHPFVGENYLRVKTILDDNTESEHSDQHATSSDDDSDAVEDGNEVIQNTTIM